ncbi:hypothetical protein ACFY1P_19845 [Streptomyces sp. NPDC001407]|uniref:hypothetical protein n=1 Tax=Streptomyces sp. NPDC001407 TaxID=3364573 RepID=UPI00367DC02A
MIATRFRPSEIESLVRIAGALADSPSAADLSQPYRELAGRAREAVLAEATGNPSPAVSAVWGARPGEQVWRLRIWNRHEDTTYIYSTRTGALSELAAYVRECWDNLSGRDGVPERPPADDSETVELYYGPSGTAMPDEGYDLVAEDVIRPQRGRIVPVHFAFPEGAEAAALNRAAVFHPADNDGPQCMEVVGVLTFAYLDPEDGVLRISVHLDGADPEHIVRPDGTVPLRVQVEDTVVLDDSQAGAPHPTVLEELLGGADTAQKAAITAAALSTGLMWRCPACQWANPRAATGCEGRGCRTPQPPATASAQSFLASASVPALEGPR